MSTRKPTLLVLALLLLFTGLRAADRDPRDREAREAFADHDYRRAVSLCRELLAATPGDPAAEEWSMLVVRGLSLADEHEACAMAAGEFDAAYPDSRYRAKVDFLAGRSLLLAGKGEAAAKTTAAALDRLAGPERREGLASLLVDEGKAALAGRPPAGPFDAGVPPDRDRALKLFGLARDLAGTGAMGEETRLLYAGAAVETKGWDLALDLLEGMPESDPRVLLLSARAYLGRGDGDAARATVERLVREHPDSSEAPAGLLALDDPEHLARLVSLYPDHPSAPAAALRRGRLLVEAGRVDPAVLAFDDATARFPGTEVAAEAAIAAADALFAAARYDEARGRYDEFLRAWPLSPEWARARERIAESFFRPGETKLEAGDLDGAAAVWSVMRASNPTSPWAAKSLSLEAAKREGPKAVALLRELLARHPKSDEAPAAALSLAEALADGAGSIAQAVEAYRRVAADYPGSDPAKTAAEKLAVLRDESLVVNLPAPRRPGEPPALEVRTRNLEKLEGRVWRLDPVEYVGKRGSFDGIADLLVDAIAPEKSFTVAVPDHEAFRESRFPVTVPVDGPGTFVVVLEGGKLKATGLLLVSGITVVTKESPHGVLAFVQEAGSGKPVEGAGVHVRDSNGAVHRLSTGSDGVARIHGPSGGVSVVATYEGSAAYEGFGPVKREVTALDTRIHVSTDRSLYRPGDTVKYRVVVRRASGGLLVTPTGEEVEVTVTDDAGNRIHDRKSNLSAFGTTAGEIELPADLPPDRYRIHVKLRDHAETGIFVVEAYRKPQLFLEIEPERTDFLRGDEVRLAVTARHSFGAPARDLPVEVSLDGNSGRTGRSGRRWSILGTTDAEGRIEVTVPTAVGGSHFLDIGAETTDVTGRLYRADLRMPLYDAAFEAAVATNRESVFAGETVAVTVRTADHDGKPVAAKGALEIAHAEPGAEGFLVESKIAVATNAEGRAEVPFEAKKPGRYRLVWTGVDRGGREVLAGAVLDVAAPAADRIAVRTDRTLYRVGESAKLSFTLPAAGLWALATSEGEDVYDYRVVKFAAEDASLEIPLDKHHVPDAWLRVAVVAGGRLYTGGQRVEVGRELVVTVTPEKRELAPGGKCRLTVKTTDDRGEPVPAEVAVAVVDEGIFLLRADDTPALAATFRPPSRGDLVRTGSSLDFSFTAITGRIPEDLLAERARREMKTAKKGVILEEKSLDEEMPFEGEDSNAAIGIGGGAGGAFGGRGGHRNLRAEGGGAATGRAAAIQARSEFRDTAFWRADVVTGEDGTASVEFDLPHDLTEWRITARGASHENAFGETRTSVLASLPLVVRAALPRYLRAGDETSPAVGVVNATNEAVAAEVGVSPARDADVKTETLELPAGGEKAVRWDLPTGAAGELKVLARATAGDAADAEARTLPVLPLGVAWRTGFSGDSAGGGAVTITIPDDVAPGSIEATLRVSPGLMSAALDGTQMLRDFPFGCTEQTVNRFWPALELARAIRQLGLDAGAALPELDRTVVSGIRRLTYLQNKEGLWGWWGGRATNAEMTGLALLALGRAKELGYDVPDRALSAVYNGLPALLARPLPPDDRALVLLGRSRIPAGADFESLAPVFADRSRLSLRGLAFLLAAYGPLGKTTASSMLVDEIRARLTDPTAADTETLGWLTMALADAGADDDLLRTLAAEIVRRRDGRGFGTTRATGAVVAGVAHASWITGLETPSTEVRVARNGEEILRTKLGGNPLDGRTIRIPAGKLVAGRNVISVAGSGGRFGYSFAVRAVTRRPPTDTTGLDVARTTTLVAAPTGAGGGKDIVRKGGRAVETEVSTVRPGEVVRVTLDVANARDERYLVVEDPIPAGFEPVPDAAEGPFASATRYEDRMVFFLESAPREATVSYLLRAEVPGRVAAPPAIVCAMYEPALASWSAEAEMTVAADGGDRDATAGLAARQLLDAAKSAHAEGRTDDAWNFVTTLLDRYELEPAALAGALRLRAAIASAAGRPADVVASFERMRVELPTVPTTFADERAFAVALAAVGRHGEAVSVLDRAAGVLFAEERPLADALGGEAGEKLLDRLIDEFPFAPCTEEAARIRANAAAAAGEGAIAAGKPLDDAALATVFSFLVDFPESAAGADLDLRRLRLLLRAGRFDELVVGARRFGDRWAGSHLVDDSEWFLAYGLFGLDRFDEAEEVARRSLPRSGYKSNLWHLLAQIAHARGNLDEAVGLYAKVKDVSADALAAYRMLTEETLSVPEVTRAKPDFPAKLRLKAKNLGKVTVSLYPVDLLVWFTLEKDLGKVARMNLLGLPPEETIEAALAAGPRRREAEYEVDLGKHAAGAWLAVVRGGDLEARGLLLATDLEATVRRDGSVVRIQVTDDGGRPAPGAWVKIAVNGTLVAEGATDARGIFEAADVPGGDVSAVARKNTSCALPR